LDDEDEGDNAQLNQFVGAELRCKLREDWRKR